MKRFRGIAAVLLLCGVADCGPAELTLPAALIEDQPMVTATDPAHGSARKSLARVHVVFSRPIDAASIHRESFAILPGVDPDIAPKLLLERWRDRLYRPLDGAVEVSEEGREIIYTPEVPLTVAGTHAIVVTPAVRSAHGVPFSQTPGAAPTPFIGLFTIEASREDRSTVVSAEAIAVATDGEKAEPASETPQRPAALAINEVLYDAAGPDTNGYVFVELRGTPGAALGGYQVQLINGDNGAILDALMVPSSTIIPEDGLFVIADTVTGSANATNVAGADWVINFDPQNGPDVVRLLDPEGGLVDVLGYGTPLPAFGGDQLPLYEGSPAADAKEGQSLSR
ncbi:MAG: lamin tail domain-containing protein, partial [Deltaproteobacteria bacterium]|nr:lamin tail domain-containing protein [Deltaproteobacteria bacterium]